MARRRSTRTGFGSLVRGLLLLAIGGAIGGAIVRLSGGPAAGRPLPSLPAAQTAPVAAEASDRGGDAVARLSRAELEKETRRLRRELDERDKQIADLSIQIKLMEAGSAGKSAKPAPRQ